MNKQDLVKAIATEAGLSQVDSKKALEAFENAVKKSLVKRAARKGINPANGKPLQIKAKKVAKFKVGSKLAEAVAK